jgi:hypothetical protein
MNTQRTGRAGRRSPRTSPSLPWPFEPSSPETSLSRSNHAPDWPLVAPALTACLRNSTLLLFSCSTARSHCHPAIPPHLTSCHAFTRCRSPHMASPTTGKLVREK